MNYHETAFFLADNVSVRYGDVISLVGFFCFLTMVIMAFTLLDRCDRITELEDENYRLDKKVKGFEQAAAFREKTLGNGERHALQAHGAKHDADNLTPIQYQYHND